MDSSTTPAKRAYHATDPTPQPGPAKRARLLTDDAADAPAPEQVGREGGRVSEATNLADGTPQTAPPDLTPPKSSAPDRETGRFLWSRVDS